MQLRQLIKEEIAKVLTEIGEGVTPYPFKQLQNSPHLIAYTFTTDTNDQYVVKFVSGYSQSGIYTLVFYPGTTIDDDDKIDAITNKGTMFRILSTVISIVKTLISKNKNVTGFNWIGIKSDKPRADAQRDRLYKAYLQKNINQFPNWKIVPDSIVTKLRKIS